MNLVLLAEDENLTRRYLCDVLQQKGIQVIEAANGREAVERFRQQRPSAVILDLYMPVLGGLETLTELKEIDPNVPVIIVTASGDLATAIETMKMGAYDFLAKPVEPGKLILTVSRAIEKHRLGREIDRLHVFEEASLEWLLGRSPAMRRIIEQIKQVAVSDFSVILQGETGAGKTFIAKMLHNMSRRAKRPFVKVDLAALPETLMESELLGYEKGAFTGAVQSKKGFFETADKGTLFIDDIENLSPAVQSKLLGLVEEKTIYPVGGRSEIKVDVRIITATNRNIRESVMSGSFRQDLFFRLGEFIITMPPLRERPEDIIFFAGKFMEDAASELKKPLQSLSSEAADYLTAYHWPGNIRELKNVMRRAVLLSAEGMIEKEHIEFLIGERDEETESFLPMALKDAVGKVEQKLIAKVLEVTQGNRAKAASILQIDVKTLRQKIAEHGIG
jgi:DNA-binding NtrC family response regulator